MSHLNLTSLIDLIYLIVNAAMIIHLMMQIRIENNIKIDLKSFTIYKITAIIKEIFILIKIYIIFSTIFKIFVENFYQIFNLINWNKI